MKNVLYYDVETEVVKTAQHVAFDEAMNDVDDKPPNARLLDGLHNGDKVDLLDLEDFPLPDLDVSLRPFTSLTSFTVRGGGDLCDDLWRTGYTNN